MAKTTDPTKINKEEKITKTETPAPTMIETSTDTAVNDEISTVVDTPKEEITDPKKDAVAETPKEEKKAPKKEAIEAAIYLDFDANQITFGGMTESEKLIKVMNTTFDKKTLNKIIQAEFKDDDKVTDEITNLIEDHMKYKMFYQKHN
jgi:hypothetical protein